MENDRVKIRLPIQKGLLEMLLFEIGRFFINNEQPYLIVLFRALFSLAYYGMMRVGELTLGPHVLKACDVHSGDNKHKLMLTLYTSKTHGPGTRPQKIKITAINTDSKQGRAVFCPVRLVKKFMQLRGHFQDQDEQLFIFKDRSPVKPEHFRSILRVLL